MADRFQFVFVVRSGLAIGALLSLGVHAEPPAGQWRPVPVFSDEFEGDRLDGSRWEVNNRFYPGKKPGLYAKHNTVQKAGYLNLWAQAETLPNSPSGYAGYTVAYVTSRQMLRYGYIEARARVMDSEVLSAFWLYRWTETGTYEIDVFEIGGAGKGHENVIHTNAHAFRGAAELENDSNRLSDPKSHSVPERLSKDFHLYALEWDEHFLKYYYDGKLIRTKPNSFWHQPMTIRFTTETHPDWMGLPKPHDLPAVFQVDYVRVWQKPEHAAGQAGATDSRAGAKDVPVGSR